MNSLVSVVIPVYNAEEYLREGVESLLKQTYDSIEIILVDDISTDNSWALCKDFAKKYKSKVYAYQNKKNEGGPLRGRELGIQKARGQWITFMDCDDYVEPDYIQNLVNATSDGLYDIAVTGYQKVFDDGSKEEFLWDNYSQSTEERLRVFYQHFLSHNFWTDPADTVGQNLVRAEVAKKTDLSHYPSNIWAEDTLMALAFLANTSNGINFVDAHDFNWRQRAGSGSHGGFSSRADKKSFFEACSNIFHKDEVYAAISTDLPLVSVVVPVYNVEKFLEECLESITAQSYRSLQIICVNDGSTDRSEDVIDTYTKKDSRVTKVNKKNAGLNAARESGVAIARGQYITFVDSDDMIHEDSIRELYEQLVKENTDISVGGYESFSVKDEIAHNDRSTKTIIAENSNVAIDWLLTGNLKNELVGNDDVLRMTAWAKLYKAELIKNTDWKFSDYQTNEDEFEVLQWFNMAKNGISVTTKPVYLYRVNPESKTRKKYSNKSPSGKSVDRFELAYDWQKHTKTYLGAGNFEPQINQRFMWLLQNAVVRSTEEGALASEIDSAVRVIERFQHGQESVYRQKNARLDDILSSRLWRATGLVRKVYIRAPLRLMAKVLRAARHPRRVVRKLRTLLDDRSAERRYSHAWIVTDRPEEASDNGILFYNYLAREHPEVNAFFVISQQSEGFRRLKARGVRVVDYGSREHEYLARYADIDVSAFFNFAPFDHIQLKRERPLKRAFILHGMDQSDLSQHYTHLAADLYSIVTKDSYDFYKQARSLVDITDKNLQITGMPRYDLLREKLQQNKKLARNKIVIAPTWRRFLLYKPGTVEKQPNGYLVRSNYYKYYTDLFNSAELKALSKQYEIVLIPHPEMLARIEEFNIPDYIEMKTYKELGTDKLYDLALGTALFVTDFSSTVFDFAFLGAKIAHFNFDESDYYSDKQELYRSWFQIDKDGFGPSFKQVGALKRYVKSEKWETNQRNIDKIWKQIPERSSELIYEHIKELI